MNFWLKFLICDPCYLFFFQFNPPLQKKKKQLDSNLLSKGLNGAKKKKRIKLKIFKIMLL
jgi:hypothetical protein